MNQEKILKTLLSPIVSEKTTMNTSYNQYAFKVTINSTKKEIKAAIEKLFGVDVVNVNTSIVKGKVKMLKGRSGRRSDWKKATIRLSDGQMIDISKN